MHISPRMKSRDNGAQTTPDERNEDKTSGELKYRQRESLPEISTYQFTVFVCARQMRFLQI